MLKKFIILTLVVLLESNFYAVSAQDDTQKIYDVKYKLTNFRNPSDLRGRFGLLLFSPDEKRLATIGTTRDVVIYDLADGAVKATINNGNAGFNAVSFNPDGERIILQDADYGAVGIYETASGKLVREIDGGGKLSSSKKIMLDTQRNVGGLEMPAAPVTSDWESVLIAKNEGEYRIVNPATGEEKFNLFHSDKPNAVLDFLKMAFGLYVVTGAFLISNGQFSADGNYIIIANGNKTPTLWNAKTGNLIAKLEADSDQVFGAAFSPNNQLTATSDLDGVTRIWKTATGELAASVGSKKERSYFTAWSADGERVVTNALKKDARVWNARNGEPLFTLDGSKAASVVFSPDGKLIATTPQQNKKIMAQIWSAENGKLLASVPRQKSEDRAFSLVWSPDSRMLVTPSSDFVRVWSAGGKPLQTLENAVFPARFNSGGTLLATGGKNDVGYVWQIK